MDVYESLCMKYYGHVWNGARWIIFRSFVPICSTAVAVSWEGAHHRNSTGHLLAGRMEMQRKLQKATLHDKKMKIRSRQTANCDVQQKPKIMPPPSKEQVEKKMVTSGLGICHAFLSGWQCPMGRRGRDKPQRLMREPISWDKHKVHKWDWVAGKRRDEDIHCSTRRSTSREHENYIFGAGDPTPLTK